MLLRLATEANHFAASVRRRRARPRPPMRRAQFDYWPRVPFLHLSESIAASLEDFLADRARSDLFAVARLYAHKDFAASLNDPPRRDQKSKGDRAIPDRIPQRAQVKRPTP